MSELLLLITFLFTLLLLVFAAWFVFVRRLRALEARLDAAGQQDRVLLEHQLAELTARVFQLEQRFGGATSFAAQDKDVPAADQTPKLVFNNLEGAAPVVAKPARLFPDKVPEATWRERFKRFVGDEGWEMLFAGSILNKVGALVLVIGIALFLGYSFTRVNPAGRAAASALISAGILAAGILFERHQRYKMFSRGLIGAGWAALYVTAYAMYALPAAKIIDNPFAGSILLAGVGAGMIVHSLQYRNEGATALAYFAAFSALVATPSTPFAVASLIPLVASLLYLAWRFGWYGMSLFGLAATHATCISKSSSDNSLALTELILVVIWALFEAFDILRSKRAAESAKMSWIFPSNAAAFLMLSYRTWLVHAPRKIWQMAAIASALYLASALTRGFLPPRVGARPRSGQPLDSIRYGSYEPPLTIAAVLAGLAILGRVTGFWTNIYLAAEAELLYLGGIRLRSRALRSLGTAGFVVSLGDIAFGDSGRVGTLTIAGKSVHSWAPSVLAHAGVFYLNSALWKSTIPFSFAATGLVALLLAAELPSYLAPGALFAFGLILLEIGLRKQLREFRAQSYLVAASAAVLTLWGGGFAPHASGAVWACSAASAVACWLFSARVTVPRTNEIAVEEIVRVRDSFATLGSFFCLVTLWMLFPGAATIVTWTSLAIAWTVVARFAGIRSFRWLGAGVMGVTCVRLLGVNLGSLWASQSATEKLLIPMFLVAGLYFLWHVFRTAPESREHAFAPVFTFSALVIIMALLYRAVSGGVLTVAWGLVALVYLAVGFPLRERVFRIQGLAILAFCILKLFLYDLRNLETFQRILSFIALGLILLGVSWIYTRFRVQIRRYI